MPTILEYTVSGKRTGLFYTKVSHQRDGQRCRHALYGKTRPDVARKLHEAQVAIDQGRCPVTPRSIKKEASGAAPSGETVSDFLTATFLPLYMKLVRPATYRVAKSCVNTINHYIGKVRFDEQTLTTEVVQRMCDGMVADGKGARAIELAKQTLDRAMTTALKKKRFSHSPCKGVEIARAEPNVGPIWYEFEDDGETPGDMRRFLAHEAVKTDRLFALYYLTAKWGVRQGELLALEWDDLQLEGAHPKIHIQRGLTQDHDGKLVGTPTKTSGSDRTIWIDDETVRVLLAHRAKMEAECSERSRLDQVTKLVFPNTQGNPINCNNLRERSFKELIKKAGVTKIRFHNLRHTAAVFMYENGVAEKTIRDFLGHVDFDMLRERYLKHRTPRASARAAETMGKVELWAA